VLNNYVADLKSVRDASADLKVFEFTHSQVVWPLQHNIGKIVTPVVVHLKANGKLHSDYTKGSWNTGMWRQAEFAALLGAIGSMVNPILMGDFNFGLPVPKFVKMLLKTKKSSEQVRWRNTLIQLIANELDMTLKSIWPLCLDAVLFRDDAPVIKTMVDPRNQKIHDLILCPHYLFSNTPNCSDNTSGVLSPDKLQESLAPLGQFTVVKKTYLSRLRIATYTDHWPVFGQFLASKLDT